MWETCVKACVRGRSGTNCPVSILQNIGFVHKDKVAMNNIANGGAALADPKT